MRMLMRSLLIATVWVFVATTAFSALIMGPDKITASTDIGFCTNPICQGLGRDINQIADGDATWNNGFAGKDFEIGTITLDLAYEYDLSSFALANDINVFAEGVESFALHFFDSKGSLISASPLLLAPVGQSAPEIYNFPTPVLGVSSVDFEITSLLNSVWGTRIEVREVYFEGVRTTPIPVPGSMPLAASAIFGLWFLARRRRSNAIALG